MSMNILAVGDICGDAGLRILAAKLGTVKRHYDIAFTVVNGENANGLGIMPKHADMIFDAGADLITLGNHTWSRKEICAYLDDNNDILRPANFARHVPGRGWGIFEAAFGSVCVANLLGRVEIDIKSDNPFTLADDIIEKAKKEHVKVILVDFHASATSEKYAMAFYLDGRVTALWGTHTHVQTSDACVFPGGMGYITDLGMTGATESVIGMKPEQSISNFLGNPPERFLSADGLSRIEGAVFEVDEENGKCVSVEAVRIS